MEEEQEDQTISKFTCGCVTELDDERRDMKELN